MAAVHPEVRHVDTKDTGELFWRQVSNDTYMVTKGLR